MHCYLWGAEYNLAMTREKPDLNIFLQFTWHATQIGWKVKNCERQTLHLHFGRCAFRPISLFPVTNAIFRNLPYSSHRSLHTSGSFLRYWEWEQRPFFEIMRSAEGQANRGWKHGTEEEPSPLIETLPWTGCWTAAYCFRWRVHFRKILLYHLESFELEELESNSNSKCVRTRRCGCVCNVFNTWKGI